MPGTPVLFGLRPALGPLPKFFPCRVRQQDVPKPEILVNPGIRDRAEVRVTKHERRSEINRSGAQYCSSLEINFKQPLYNLSSLQDSPCPARFTKTGNPNVQPIARPVGSARAEARATCSFRIIYGAASSGSSCFSAKETQLVVGSSLRYRIIRPPGRSASGAGFAGKMYPNGKF